MNKKQLPAGVRFLLGFISVILCIVLFVCSIVTILVADLSLLTSKGGLQKLIQDVLFSTSAPARPGFSPAGVLPGRVPVRFSTPEEDMMGGIDFGSIDFSGIISGDSSSGAIADMLFGILEEQFPEEQLPISKEDVTNFVEESTLTDFISDKVSGIVVDVINGEVTTTITKEEVVELLEENKQLIEDTFKTEIPDEVIESVGTFVEESKLSETIQQSVADIVGVEISPTPDDEKPSDGNTVGSSGSDLKKPLFRPGDLDVLQDVASGNFSDMGFSKILALVRIITAPVVLISCIAVCLLISALLFLTNWGRPNAALRCSGTTYFIAGLLFLLPSAVAQFAPSVFTGMGIIGNAIRQILALAGTISLGVTLFGLALIIGGAVWGGVLKKKRIAAAAASAAVTEDAAGFSEVLLAAEKSAGEAPAEESPAVTTADDESDLVEALLGTQAPVAEETEV
ncbi:MAG: hypothetical protein IJF02_06415 [Oscillospiraceae bacterium]|nr:hypothetical protein [Oscillospiraceae bacterium]